MSKKLSLANQLWSIGIRCFVCDIHLSVDDVLEVAADCGASFVAVLHDTEASVRLKNLTDKDRVTERRVSLLELVDFLQKQLTKPSMEAAEHSSSSVGHVR